MKRQIRTLALGILMLAASRATPICRAADEPPTPKVPEGMMLIEEDVWYQLADEPNFHFHHARLDFLRREPARAAGDIKKAAAMIKLAIGLAQGEAKKELRASAFELTLLAEELEHGKPVTLTALNKAFSRAHIALARYNQEAAEIHVKGQQFARGGMHLRAAAHDLAHARAWAGGELSAGATAEVVSAEELAKELLAGSGFAVQEILQNLTAIAKEVEALRALHAAEE